MPKARPGGHGGYRAPSKPAAHSGPGALSQRTDGGPAAAVQKMIEGVPAESVGTYGSKAQLARIQQTVPRGQVAPAGSGPPPPGAPTDGIASGLFDPTARPDEPLTAGAVLGPGPGPSNMPLMSQRKEELIQAMVQATGGHPDIMRIARRAGLA